MSERLVLRPASERDLDFYFELRNRPEILARPGQEPRPWSEVERQLTRVDRPVAGARVRNKVACAGAAPRACEPLRARAKVQPGIFRTLAQLPLVGITT